MRTSLRFSILMSVMAFAIQVNGQTPKISFQKQQNII